METLIKTLKDTKTGNNVLPRTRSRAITMEDGRNLDDELVRIEQQLINQQGQFTSMSSLLTQIDNKAGLAFTKKLNKQIFMNNGNFVVPKNITELYVTACAGGGGGAGGGGATGTAGNGGSTSFGKYFTLVGGTGAYSAVPQQSPPIGNLANEIYPGISGTGHNFVTAHRMGGNGGGGLFAQSNAKYSSAVPTVPFGSGGAGGMGIDGSAGGAGGTSGEYTIRKKVDVSSGETIQITIGSGGTKLPCIGTNGMDGQNGGNGIVIIEWYG